MGNNITIDWNEQLRHQFVLLETQKKHNVLGEIDIYQYIPDEKVKIFSKITTVPNKEYFLQKTKLQHPNLLRALAIDDTQQKNENGDKLYKIYYDYPGDYTLDTISKGKQNRFSESSLWNIIFSVVDCAEYLQTHYKSIGNLNPNTIYVLEDGIKLLDTNHLFSIYSSYEKVQQNQKAILSPEQIDQLSRNIERPNICQFKSDVYCFGIVLLCLISKSDCSTFYTQTNDLDKNQVFQKLQFLKSNYSELLHGLIAKMLSENPNERQSWIDIKKFIDPFKIMSNKDLPFYQEIRLCPQVNKILPLQISPKVQPQQVQSQFLQSQQIPQAYQFVNSARLAHPQQSQQIPVVNTARVAPPIQSQQVPFAQPNQIRASKQLVIPQVNKFQHKIVNNIQQPQIPQNLTPINSQQYRSVNLNQYQSNQIASNNGNQTAPNQQNNIQSPPRSAAPLSQPLIFSQPPFSGNPMDSTGQTFYQKPTLQLQRN